MVWRRSSLRALLGLACLPALPSPALERFEATEPHMGTLFRLVVYSPDVHLANQALRSAFLHISQLDSILSDYQPNSELNRLCDSAYERPITVSHDLARVLDRSLQLSRQTDGAFDVTAGPLIKLWRQARQTRRLPDPAAVAAARSRTGYTNVALNGRAVRLLQPGMQIDLGGVAKGYAADQALRTLRSFGLTRALVAASGDIAVGLPPPDQPGWRIAVEPRPGVSRTLVLKNAAVSTSGDTEQYIELNGTRYSHIVDPRTGLGLTDSVGVTVTARQGFDADPLATAIALVGPVRGLTLLKQTPNAAALIVQSNPTGQLITASPSFPAS